MATTNRAHKSVKTECGKKSINCRIKTFFSVLLTVGILLISSCSDIFEIPTGKENAETGKGYFSLSVNMGASGRTILPTTLQDDFQGYLLKFTTDGREPVDIYRHNWNLSEEVLLNTGIWNLEVTAFIDGMWEKPVATGNFNNIDIGSGTVVQGNVMLIPIITGDGEGIFNWRINYPVNVNNASMTITRINESGDPDTKSIYKETLYFVSETNSITSNNDFKELPVGCYSVVIRLENSEGKDTVRRDILYIYQNMVSSFAFTFTEKYFDLSYGTTDIKFNLEGARAVLSSEDTGTNSRSVLGSANTLFKILGDDSILPILDSNALTNSNNPMVRFIVRSPIEGRRDLFINFDNNWSFFIGGYWAVEPHWVEGKTLPNGQWQDGYHVEGEWIDHETVNIGRFIHVKEDGSIVPILIDEPGQWSSVNEHQGNNPVAFDLLGNMYFTVSESNNHTHTNVIYKYDPITHRKEQLTPSLPNIHYGEVQLSSDGAYIIAKGGRWSNNTSIEFLRLITIANPDVFTNIYYRSNGGGSIHSFVLNPAGDELFISGSNIYNDGSNNWTSGLYKVSINGFTRDDLVWTPILTNNINHNIIYYTSDGTWINGYQRQEYTWNSVFLKTDGTPDYSRVMEELRMYFRSDNIEFRHPNYPELTNEAALAAITTQYDFMAISLDPRTWTYNNLFDFCYIPGTDTKAVRNDLHYDFGNTILYITADNSVWGISNTWVGNSNRKIFAQLVDANGKRDFYMPKSMEDRIVINIKPSDSHVYFLADVTTNPNNETGFQNIYRFSYNDPEIVQNVFVGIVSRNINTMEIYTYDIGGGYLFFGGTQGASLVTGKINLTTLRYTELEFGQRILAMVSF